MTKMKKLISVLLSVIMVFTMLTVISTAVTSAATANISYSFKNTKVGYAEGKITVTPTNGNYGTYYLYWADNTKALDGYQPIATLSISSGSKSYTMPAYTAIPANATKVVAVKASSTPNVSSVTVSGASAVYTIPSNKKLKYTTDDMIYSFASISDPQIANDSYGSGKYPYDETHLAAAFETLADRKVDFSVVSGDVVNDQNGNQTYDAEYKVYERILADSSYVNPIYEANGNHEVWADPNSIGIPTFIKETGLDSVKSTISAGKPYFEITEPTSGDHFIFMALEGTFYTNQGTQFSTSQLDWLEGLLKKYHGDGNNIFIIEHGNIEGWGSGDKATAPYYYDLGLKKDSSDVKRFISLMEKYKECVIITAHTHLELSAQLNYSDNNGTSAVMMHNSAIGGVRRLVNGVVNRDPVLGLSEGYIVEVYNSCILFKGINLYYNEIMPSCSYIIPFSTGVDEEPTTVAPTTVKPTTAPPTTVKPTTVPPTTVAPTTEPVIEYLRGDADDDGRLTVKDVTILQLYLAGHSEFIKSEKALKQADTSNDGVISIMDATYIQLYLAELIDEIPDESARVSYVASANIKSANFTDTLKAVANDLDSYYRYSSYDQYQALKKAYYEYKDANLTSSQQTSAITDLTEKQEALYEISGKRPDDNNDDNNEEYTVYFTNNYNWSTVKAYVWGSAGKIASWPGTSMTYVTTNSYNQKIYSITFNYNDYQKIIFTNGSQQTVDITLTGEKNLGYYISGESGGKLTCKTYTYS